MPTRPDRSTQPQGLSELPTYSSYAEYYTALASGENGAGGKAIIERGDIKILITSPPALSGDPRPGSGFVIRPRPPRPTPQEPTKPPEDPGTTIPRPEGCPDPDTLILLSDGSQKRAGDLQVGDVVRTQHEDTLEWGEHKITYVEIKGSEKLVLTFDNLEFICSTSHKFYVEGKGWTSVNQMEIGDFVIGLEESHKLLEVNDSSYGDVVVIQVEDAHTYISEGLLSHNKTIAVPDPNPPTGNPTPVPGFPVIPPSGPSGGGTFVPGPVTQTTTTTSTTQTRNGLSTRINTSITNRSLGDRLVSLDVLPYMRSRNVEFIAKKLKPNTLVYPFFDSQNVYRYIVPKILEIEMISGTFITGETVSGMLMESENVNVNSTSTETSIQFRLATYNHKYGPFNAPTDTFSSSPYNIADQLQPYSPSSTTLNVDITSLSDLSLGTYGGNVFIGMTLIGNQSGATARVIERRLVTDNIGTVMGSFFIPNPNLSGNPRFSTGNKTFRLTDNPTNGTIAGTLYTYANANFFADGLITQAQESILALRNVETQTAFTNETRVIANTTITDNFGDPIFVPTFTPQGPGPGPTPGPFGGGGGTGGGPTFPTPPGPGGPEPGPTPGPTPAPTALKPFTITGGKFGPGTSNKEIDLVSVQVFLDTDGDGLYDTVQAILQRGTLDQFGLPQIGISGGGQLFKESNIQTISISPELQQAVTEDVQALQSRRAGPNGDPADVTLVGGGGLAGGVGIYGVVGLRGGPLYTAYTDALREIDSQIRAAQADRNFALVAELEAQKKEIQNSIQRTGYIDAGIETLLTDIAGIPLEDLPRTLQGFIEEVNTGVAAVDQQIEDTIDRFGQRGAEIILRRLGVNLDTGRPSLPGRSPASQPPAAVPSTSVRPILIAGSGPAPAPVPSAPVPSVPTPVAIPPSTPQQRITVPAPAPRPVTSITASRVAQVTSVSASSSGPQPSRSSSPTTNPRNTSGYTGTDPLAQTFKIGSDEDQTGRFITSVDLFFYTKAPELPVYVELRSVELGTPTQKIYPFSKVEILPQNINVSETGTVATRVTFHAPVFLEGNKEHALVLLSDSNDYSVFVSRLGEVDITTAALPESQQRLVSTQPTLGSLFKSQNASTWSPSQYEDLKFNMYTAVFEPTGSVSFFNPQLNRSNDQVAILRNNALDIESRRIRVGLGTTLAASTISDLTAGSFVVQQDTNAIGEFAFISGIATGSLSIPNSGIGYTPSLGIQTYSNVALTAITGGGRGATASITVTNGSISSAGISSGGTGYQVGDILTAENIGITSIGRNLRLSVQEISAFNELVIDNVQGEFEVGVAKTIRYFSAIPGIGYTDLNGGSVFANNINVDRDGLHINVKHRNHALHALTNIVSISNVTSDIAPVKLTNDTERDFTGDLVITGLTTDFNTFENVGISSTNPGYISVNSEIISYTGVSGGTLTGITRGVDSTLQIRHPANSFVYKYELGGISLRRINTTHTLQDVTDSTKENTLDSYYIKIDTSSNGVDRSVGTSLPKLYLNSTKSTGGSIIEATQNIQYEIAQPIVQTFTPPETTITASLRTISGTSIGGLEESFLDRGTQTIKLNEDNFFENPRIIASRVNERTFLNNIMQGNKSLQMTLNLSTTNQYLSPVIDLDRVGMILTSNRVNSPVTSYIAEERVSLLETDPNAFVYASTPVELEVPATSIKIIVSAHLNIYNDLRAMFAIMKDVNEKPTYYPFPGSGNITGDGRTINVAYNNGRPDLPLKLTSKLGFQSEELNFTDYEFTINNLESFKYFSIKLIGSSTSQTYPPRLRDLRIIALA